MPAAGRRRGATPAPAGQPRRPLAGVVRTQHRSACRRFRVVRGPRSPPRRRRSCARGRARRGSLLRRKHRVDLCTWTDPRGRTARRLAHPARARGKSSATGNSAGIMTAPPRPDAARERAPGSTELITIAGPAVRMTALPEAESIRGTLPKPGAELVHGDRARAASSFPAPLTHPSRYFALEPPGRYHGRTSGYAYRSPR